MPFYAVTLEDKKGTQPIEADSYPLDKKVQGVRVVGGLCTPFNTREDCLSYICPEKPGLICKECKGLVDSNFYGKEELLEAEICITCDFWRRLVKRNGIRIDGKHYSLGANKHKGPYNGFGGTHFTIRMNSGELIETVDLWHNGIVPPHFKSRLPDNAVFVKP